MKITDARRVHFIGVGGVGMSAIAKVLIEQGIGVSGSDLKRSRAVTTLEAMGAEIRVGHAADAVEGADLVVRSSAIPDHNPELKKAVELDLPVLSRGEALAEVLRTTKSIVVAGTHGKTTTTSMIVSILRCADTDPTYLVGGGLNDSGTNGRYGKGPWSVAESDESDGSFLLLTPHIGVVTNIEADHLDYWPSLEALREAFERFVASVPAEGAAVLPSKDEDLIRKATGKRVVTFGAGAEVRAEEVELRPEGMRFDLVVEDSSIEIVLGVPGGHNVDNALAAAASTHAAGISVEAIAAGLKSYKGVERRFQIRGTAAGVTIIDDYAHHPSEIRATLSAARSGSWNRVLAVFQPHRYSRTIALSDEFGMSFGDADLVVVTDVYGAGEEPVPGVSGKLVSDSVCRSLPGRSVAYLPHRDELIAYLKNVARDGDALLTLGAGDVTLVGEELLGRLQSAAPKDGS